MVSHLSFIFTARPNMVYSILSTNTWLNYILEASLFLSQEQFPLQKNKFRSLAFHLTILWISCGVSFKQSIKTGQWVQNKVQGPVFDTQVGTNRMMTVNSLSILGVLHLYHEDWHEIISTLRFPLPALLPASAGPC